MSPPSFCPALDKIQLFTTAAPKNVPVHVRLFDASNADIGTGKDEEDEKAESDQMKAEAPKLIASAIVSELKKMGSFKSVALAEGTASPTDAIFIEGQVTKLNPGSRQMRYFVGFGAGKSTVQVKGVIKDASGNVLATFEQEHHGAVGWGGGDSIKMMTKDAKEIGEDIAEFLDRWTRGQKLD